MEPVRGSRKASKFTQDNNISSMPPEILINILDRLPLQDVVRTSILSSYWRSKWTMTTQLIFDEDFYKYLQKRKTEKHYGSIISCLLLIHKRAIAKFVLYIQDECYSILDVNSWVLSLSKKGIKEFTIKNMGATPLDFPTHLFSCLKLKHLKLYNCHFSSESSFQDFPNLLRLDLCEVVFRSYTCGEFLTRCPLLETLKLRDNIEGEIKEVEISKLKNLKVLILQLCELDDIAMITSSSIFRLLSYFPKLQELNLDFWNCKLLADAEMRFPATLPRLKTLRLYEIDFSNGVMVSFAIELICCSPNLETLVIKVVYDPPPTTSPSEVDYNTMGQLQLGSVVFTYLRGLKNEVCSIKYLLSCSPLLKKMDIHSHKSMKSDEKLMYARKLLKLPRASHVAEIDFC